VNGELTHETAASIPFCFIL